MNKNWEFSIITRLYLAIFSLALVGLGISACGRGTSLPPPDPLPTLQPTAEGQEIAAVTATPTQPPTITLTALPTSLPTSTIIPPTLTASPPPTATPTPLHPLMIEVMRQHTYPGSEITFEQILEPADTYDRYIISYLSEGNKIFAYLTKPHGPKPATGFPLVIFNHGYIPPNQYRTTERYVDYVDAFARNGYMVFRSDYRGHGSSEGVARGGYSSPDYTVDVLNGLAAAKNLPSADPNRIGMWGHSMGGYITLRSMVVNNEIKAGVIWAGVVVSYPDLIERWRRRADGSPTPTPNPQSTRGRRRNELYATYGTPEENPAFWAAISSNSYLSDLSGPIQLHHGTADTSVPYEFSEILTAEIQEVGIPVEFYGYPNDNHNISINFDLAMQRSIEFFDTWVKGAP